MSNSQIARALLVGALSAGVSFGATAVARVISTEPVDVDGISMPARNFAPVSIGDEVATQAGPAVVQFSDGSDVTLQPRSRIRVEGKATKLQVRILLGSATYNLVPTSRLHIVDSKGEVISRVLTVSLPDTAALTKPGSPMATEALYTAASLRQPGTVLPATAVSVGQFTGGGTFHAGTAANTATIVTPSGLTFNLTAVTNSAGQVTGYTVSSITATVTTPGGGTSTVTVTSGSLIGTTISGVSGSTQSGSSVNNIQFIPPGSTTPLDPNSVNQSVQNGVQQAVNQGVQNGNLPPGTQAPNPEPVKTGNFSPSAS